MLAVSNKCDEFFCRRCIERHVRDNKAQRLKKFHRSKAARNEAAEILKTVTVCDSDGTIETYTIVKGEVNGDIFNNEITDVSPFGSALLAAKNGIARAWTPNGLRILHIL